MYKTFIRKGPTYTESQAAFNELYGIDQWLYEYAQFTTIETEQAPDTRAIQYRTKIMRYVTSAEFSNFLGSINLANEYHTFSIPKHSGGYRTITAPSDRLKEEQRKIVQLLFTDIHGVPYVHAHNTAFAYVKQRSHRHAVQRHQRNNSRWFLKLDIKEFFPSWNKELLLEKLQLIWQLHYVDPHFLKTLLDVCLLNDQLPQGSPASPFLSNIAMMDMDVKLSAYAQQRKLIYTRYADDLLISSPYKFEHTKVLEDVRAILEEASHGRLNINHDKVRFGSSAGRNWNLGIMLNKDNQMTLGHQKKKQLHAELHSMVTCEINGEPWTQNEKQILHGKLAYLESIEGKPVVSRMYNKYNTKYHVDTLRIIKT